VPYESARRARDASALAVVALLSAACGGNGTVPVTPFDATAFEPSVAVFHNGFAVAWYDTRHGHGELYQQGLDEHGERRGPEVRLTTGSRDSYEADIHAIEGTASGDGFVAGWYEKGPDSTYVPRLGRWSRNGTARWIRNLAPRGRNTVVRLEGDLVFAAWIEDEAAPAAGLWTGWWNLGGETVVAPRRIADAGKTTYNLNASLVDGPPGRGVPTALVVFDAKAGTKAEELHLAEDDGLQARVARLTPDDGFPSTYPDLAISGQRASITWVDARDGNEEVYLRVVPRADLARAAAIGGSRVTNTTGHSIGAYTAWSGDRVGLAWCDDTEGQHEIYFAEFDASGTPRAETQRLTQTRAGSLIPSIDRWRGGFVVAWNEWTGGPEGHDAEGRSQVMLRIVP
jgi:hypothetical protein